MTRRHRAGPPVPARRRRGALLGSAVVALLLQPAIALPSAAAEPVDLPSAVRLEGVLVVTPVEPEPTSDHELPQPPPTGNAVTLVTSDGAAVELTGEATAEARSGDRFRGTVAVDSAVREAIRRRPAAEPGAPTVDVEELVAEASATLDRPLRVVKASLSPGARASSAATAHTVDVFYFHASGQPVPPASAVDAMVARLSEFWQSESNGQLAGIARPLAVKSATVPAARLCDASWLWAYAAGPSGFGRSPAFPGGPADSHYWAGGHASHLLALVPGQSCGVGNGLGTLGGDLHDGGAVWASLDAEPRRWDGLVFHEVGHNLGLGHSNASDCPAPAVDGPSCAVTTYADYYDVMGGGYYAADASQTYTNAEHVAALNLTHRVHLNALPRGSALQEVRAGAGAEQRFTLAPAGGTTGVRGLEVVDPLTDDRLYVEYRSGAGRDADSFYARYSAARPSDPTFAPGVRVLKSLPGQESTVLRRWTDGRTALSYGAGDEFLSRASSPEGAAGVRIAVVSLAADAAVVDIVFESELPALDQPTAVIAGAPQYHRRLTADVGPWSPAPDATGYQWLRGGAPIPGATSPGYQVQAADVGERLTVRVTARKRGYAPTAVVSAPVQVTSEWTGLTVSGSVNLPSGVPDAAWQDLRVRAFADGMPPGMPSEREATVSAAGDYRLPDLPPGYWRLQVSAGSAATDVAAQWYGGAAGPSTAAVLDLEDDATALHFSLGRSRRISGAVTLPAGADPSWLGSVTVTAEPEPEQSQPHTSPRRSTTTPDATGAYQLTGLDPGDYSVRFDVSDGDAAQLAGMYYRQASQQAARTVVTIGQDDRTGIDATMARLRTLSSPTPTVSGTPRVGVKLTAKPGRWTSGASLGYQWLVSGKPVTGATQPTFTPRKSDQGKRVTVTVTGRLAGYRTTARTSKSSAKVRGLLALKTSTPKISGAPKVGRRLAAKPGKWTSGAKLSYQWLVSSKPVPGATASTFTPRAQDAGRRIRVKVTGVKAGHQTAAKTSKSTKRVR